MKSSLRVLLLEDNEADAELVTAELERAGLHVVAERVDSRDAFTSALRDFAPAVVLSDHALAQFNAPAALEVLRAVRPAVPLIVVSGALDERTTIDCVRAGAEDVVHKSNLDRLPSSVTAALQVRKPLQKLSPRQLQVLQLVAEGLTTRDIAERLQLSVKTVDTHRSELMKRLTIHDVVGLVRYAVRVGLVPLSTMSELAPRNS